MADILQNKDYDLVSALYHASQGAQTVRKYASDAEGAGDNDAAEYFKEAEESYAAMVRKGKALLKDRL